MSERNKPAEGAERQVNPELRRSVSRRGFLTREVRQAGVDAVKQLPSVKGLLGFALRETPAQRDERLVTSLWQLLMGREPKPQEMRASLELVGKATTPDEKGDALVDVVWALCQTRDFEELQRPDLLYVRGFYRLALDREPTDHEKQAALDILAEIQEPAARAAALEGLFSGLIRSWESVLYKQARGR